MQTNISGKDINKRNKEMENLSMRLTLTGLFRSKFMFVLRYWYMGDVWGKKHKLSMMSTLSETQMWPLVLYMCCREKWDVQYILCLHSIWKAVQKCHCGGWFKWTVKKFHAHLITYSVKDRTPHIRYCTMKRICRPLVIMSSGKECQLPHTMWTRLYSKEWQGWAVLQGGRIV